MKEKMQKEIEEIQESANKKIEQVKLKYMFIDKLSKEIELFVSDKTVFIDCKNLSEVKQVLEKIKPTNTTRNIWAHKQIDSPYEISLDNPSRPSNFSPYRFKIQYDHEDFGIRITAESKLIETFLETKTGKLYDTEYTGWEGHTMSELRNMKIKMYDFKIASAVLGSVAIWYGRARALMDVKEINCIINFILNSKD